MIENEGQGTARDNELLINDTTNSEIEEKGPTEKLREQGKPQAEKLVPGAGVPGVQKTESEEIKEEINPNTE